MATTNYVTLDGMMIGEVTAGTMRNYGTDALGSVVETVSNGAAENTYQYKPYGGTLAKTGSAADPSFLWSGGSGYRSTTLTNSDYYVRRRHYSLNSAQWTTADPLWPKQSSYGYAQASPVIRADPSGLRCGSTSTSPECDNELSMSSTPVSSVTPLPWNSGWAVLAYLDVEFTCTQSCSPCCHKGVTIIPQVEIAQWYYNGPVQASANYSEADQSQSCGDAWETGCTIFQQGRDTPGISQNNWSPTTSCNVTIAPSILFQHDLPKHDEAHFVTVCNPGTLYGLTAPAHDPTAVYWGFKADVIQIVMSVFAFVQPTSP